MMSDHLILGLYELVEIQRHGWRLNC